MPFMPLALKSKLAHIFVVDSEHVVYYKS